MLILQSCTMVLMIVFLQLLYDKRVMVAWQDEAWCDENIMAEWLKWQWKRACDGEMVLVLDVHRAQKTKAIID